MTIYGVAPADAQAERPGRVGYHAFAGLMVPVGQPGHHFGRVPLSLREGDSSSQDGAFPDYEDFDLGGYALTAGLNYWF